MDAKTKNRSMREEIYAFADSDALPLRLVMAGITYPDPTYRMERNKSRNKIFVFEYVLEGKGHLSIDGKHYTATKGDTYILTPNTDQIYYADKSEPFKKIWVNIESTYLDSVLHAHCLSYGTYRFDSKIFFEQLLSVAKEEKNTAAASMAITPILLSLIVKLSGYYAQSAKNTPAHIAKQYIENCAHTVFSQAKLAEEMHISISTLTRIFRDTYKMTPYEYFLLSKERAAKNLLENTGLSAKEIAFRLGFSDEHYFSNFFKKRTGLRPLEYKRSLTDNQNSVWVYEAATQ